MFFEIVFVVVHGIKLKIMLLSFRPRHLLWSKIIIIIIILMLCVNRWTFPMIITLGIIVVNLPSLTLYPTTVIIRFLGLAWNWSWFQWLEDHLGLPEFTDRDNVSDHIVHCPQIIGISIFKGQSRNWQTKRSTTVLCTNSHRVKEFTIS